MVVDQVPAPDRWEDEGLTFMRILTELALGYDYLDGSSLDTVAVHAKLDALRALDSSRLEYGLAALITDEYRSSGREASWASDQFFRLRASPSLVLGRLPDMTDPWRRIQVLRALSAPLSFAEEMVVATALCDTARWLIAIGDVGSEKFTSMTRSQAALEEFMFTSYALLGELMRRSTRSAVLRAGPSGTCERISHLDQVIGLSAAPLSCH